MQKKNLLRNLAVAVSLVLIICANPNPLQSATEENKELASKLQGLLKGPARTEEEMKREAIALGVKPSLIQKYPGQSHMPGLKQTSTTDCSGCAFIAWLICEVTFAGLDGSDCTSSLEQGCTCKPITPPSSPKV